MNVDKPNANRGDIYQKLSKWYILIHMNFKMTVDN